MDQDKLRPVSEEETQVSLTEEQSQTTPKADWQEPSVQADPLMPAILNISNRLEILGKIGQGGMCAVYKARHLIMNKMVAVKVLLPHLISNPMMLKRFQQEAQATVILNHPNIIRIYDTDISDDGYAYIVMDFIDGESLHDLLQQEWRLKPEVALDLFVQLAQGLSHAHDHGIIHRDLKPSNVMLIFQEADCFEVKLVDFGIAKLLGQEDGQSLTQTGDVFGSPLYMSPEQCAGQRLDSRSDIYSFGCLMYETLAGQPPIVGANPLDTMQMHLTATAADFVDPESSDIVKKNLQQIIFKCLEKSPDNRYQTADELLQDLLRSNQEDFGESHTGRSDFDLARLKLPLIAVLSTLAAAVVSAAVWLYLVKTIEAPSYYADRPVWNKPINPWPEAQHFDSDRANKLKTDLENQFRSGNKGDAGNNKTPEYAQGLLDLAKCYFDGGQYSDARIRFGQYKDIQAGGTKQATADYKIALCEVKQNDLSAGLKHLQAAVEEFKVGGNPSEPPEALEPYRYKPGWALFPVAEAYPAVDYAGLLNQLPVPGASLEHALTYYSDYLDMVYCSLMTKGGKNVKEEISSQSAPIYCRLADIKRRLLKGEDSLSHLYRAGRGFGNAPDHILDEMKIALVKALVLEQQSSGSGLSQAEMVLTNAMDKKTLDPVLTDELKPDEDEPLVHSQLKHLLAQVRWRQGNYWQALLDQFWPQS